jgi:putative membrane protein insertion efficiency factor
MKSLLLALLRAYQYLLSPWIGGSCRYWPTCSEYSREAIELHGAARGSYMTLARLARCHPYGAGGVDPVPAKFRWRCWCAEAGISAGTADPDRAHAGGEPRTSEQ